MATVEKKKRRVSYVESSFDQSTSLPTLTIGTEDELLEQVRPKDGERTFPGQSLRRLEELNLSQQGFLWADTPESSVFIRKKQWNDEGWNYIIEVDPNEPNPAKKPKEQEIKEGILAGEKLNRKIRDVLGKIITSKLEWLNDHEQFTKAAAALRTLLTTEEEPKAIQAYYIVGTGTSEQFETLAQIVNKIGIAAYGDNFEKTHKEESKQIKKEILSRNTDVLRQDTKKRLGKEFSESRFQEQLANSTLKISKDIRLYYDSGTDSSLFINAKGDFTDAAKELLQNLYAPTLVSDGAFTRYFLTTDIDIYGNEKAFVTERFNGVIEFANITSISTTVNLSGNGTANLTFENPGNIMQISRDDIELALAEVPWPYKDGELLDINKVKDDSRDSNLRFYRGRYYTKTIFDNVLSKDYTDIDPSDVKINENRSRVIRQNKTVTENQVYVVKQGDTLGKIARKYDVTINEIIEATFTDEQKRNAFLQRQIIIKQTPGSTDSSTASSSARARADATIDSTYNSVMKEAQSSAQADATYVDRDDASIFANQVSDPTVSANKPSSASKKVLKGPDLIYPGEKFLIPKTKEVVEETVVEAEVEDGTLKSNEKLIARDKLRKYALNRYIIEPVDHVWIWLTSPSKSIFTLYTNEDVIEAPDSIKALELQINEIDKELDEKYAELTEVNQTKEQTKDFQIKEEADREAKKLTIELNALETRKKNLQEQLASFREAKKIGKPSTDATSANRTDLLENLTKNTELYNVISETQGLSEQQFQVFEGVITDISESYANGKYTLQASCRDVFYFLEVSRIMEKPGLRGTTGPKFELNNPIITVQNGEELKGIWKTGMLVKYDEMLFPDSKKDANIGKGSDDTTTSNKEVKKERISTITAEEKRKQTGIFITDKPFAKTDAANVVSLLITGVPYNVDLFIQNALIDGRIQLEEDKQNKQKKPSNKTQTSPKQDKQTNRDKSTREGGLNVSKNGYFQIIKRMIGVQNDLLGDFKPFVPLTPDLLSSQTEARIKKNEQEIGDLEKLADEILKAPRVKDETKKTVDLALIGSGVEKLNGPGFSDELIKKGYVKYLIDHKEQHKDERKTFITDAEWVAFSKSKRLTKKTPKPPENGSQANGVLEELYSKRKQQEELLKVPNIVDSFVKGLTVDDQTKLGTILQDRVKRREDIVRNRDENYLMISSEYTFNNDIEAFNYMISGGNWSLWQSSYETPLNTCKRVAEVVNFEFFADENGNIRFEPPRYNRILREHLPRLFGQRGPVGKKLREKFKSGNFQRFIKTIDKYKEQEELVRKIESELPTAATYRQQLNGVETQISRIQLTENKQKSLQSVLDNYFDVSTSAAAEEFVGWFLNSGLTNNLNTTNETVREGLPRSTKEYFTLKQQAGNFIQNAREFELYIRISIELYKREYTQKERLLSALNGRKKELNEKIAPTKNAEKNLIQQREELANLENQLDKMRFNLDEEGEYPKMQELTDDAKIHRIPDSIVVTSNFRESKPRFTRLDVSGEPNLVDLSSVHELYYWAGGVDYDLWRTYGFIQNAVKLPYLHRGDACKPYCEALLGRQWGQIFTAQMTVRGDSKYRVHDVVYVESRDMYYRISTVAHSFTYGNSYQTTLTLDYGRRPEFIIPDPWDILGKTVLEAAASDVQTNETITKAEQQQQKKEEEQETNKAAEKAKKETEAIQTNTETNQQEKDSDTVTQERQVTQPSPEAARNKAEQERRQAVADFKTEVKDLKQAYTATGGKLGSARFRYNSKQQEIISLEEEIKANQSVPNPDSNTIVTKQARLDKLKKELNEIEGEIEAITNEREELDAKIKEYTVTLNQLEGKS